MKLTLPLRHDARVGLLALASSLSALALGLLLQESHLSPPARWVLAGALAAGCLLLASAARQEVVRPLRTLSNLLRALREEDFSFRARVGRGDDPLGQVLAEVNALAATLHEQRLGALEAAALLRKVMAAIDVAVFAFDAGDTLRLLNRAGERLLAAPGERLIGLSAGALGLAPLLAGEPRRIADASFPAATGRFDLRRGGFRQQGQPMRLLVLADVSRALRDEERQAWHRLVRVISHELNNSLAPIRSVAASLEALIARDSRPPDWEEDARRGLRIIAARSDGLRRFMNEYARLARLPPPRRRPVDVGDMMRRVAGLEARVGVVVEPGPEATVDADPDQLEQLLINLVRNAGDAVLTRRPGGGPPPTDGVRLSWSATGGTDGSVEIRVDDDGPGLPPSANLFVPFFTTKPGGAGIGLVLCRQVAEAHGGTLTLASRPEGGCRAALRLVR